jgi:DNA-binding XRE family transcriptional regulator
MTPAIAAFHLAGRITAAVEDKFAGPAGLTTSQVNACQTHPRHLPAALVRYQSQMAADPDVAAMVASLAPAAVGPGDVGHMGRAAFWFGFYHQKAVGDLPADFARRLQALREKAGLSREQLATAAGLTRQGVNDLETGATRAPSWPTVQKLAAALGVSTDALRDR